MTMKKTACIALAAAFAAALAPYDMAAAPARRAASRPAASPAAKSTAAKPVAAKPAAAPVQTRYRKSPYVGALSLDAVSGRTLFADNADVEAYPASITKLMTAFIVLDEVSAGRLKLTDQVTASPTRTRLDVHLRQPSCIGLKAGESMSVDDLLRVMLVHSANDAAVFLVPFSSCLQSFPAPGSSESALCLRWPKYWSFSFSVGPSSEYSGLISFRMDWLVSFQESSPTPHSSKISILWHSAFFIVQLTSIYDYWKNISFD